MADFRNSGTDTVVKIVLVFFISLLSFSIGTFVGKKFSDNQHKIVAMEPTTPASEDHGSEPQHQSTTKSETASAGHANEADALNDDQVAELEQELASTEELASTSGKTETEPATMEAATSPATATTSSTSNTETPAAKAAETKPTKTIAKETEKPADKVAGKKVEEKATAKTAAKEEEKSAVAQEPAPKTASVLAKNLAAQGLGKFTIQIASYPSLEEAEKKIQELKALKFESFATEANIKGHSWYRVNVGMFSTVKEAQAHKSLLSQRAKVSTAIIQKITK